MSMPCSITGDLSIGHAGFSPAPITAAGAVTAKVLVMGVPPHVATDLIGPHVLGTSAHTGLVQDVSTTVTVTGGLGLARMMDKGDCGSLILGTGATVLVGG
jgi:uncharacterized Zn-binding protein involved in type VI secretion